MAPCEMNNSSIQVKQTPTRIDEKSVNSFLDKSMDLPFIHPSESLTSKPNINHVAVIQALLEQQGATNPNSPTPKLILS